MNHAETIELLKSGKLTRRQMTKLLASVGIGLAASPLMPRHAAASDVDLTLLEWNGYEYESFHPEYNAKYGGQPEVTFFAATEDAFQKMRAGFQCDLVHPCTGEVNMFKDAGLIKPLETDRIPRWGEIIPYLLTVKGVEIDGEYWFSPGIGVFDSCLQSGCHRHGEPELRDFRRPEIQGQDGARFVDRRQYRDRRGHRRLGGTPEPDRGGIGDGA